MPLFPRLRTFRIRLSLRLYRHVQSILLLTYYFRLKERSLLVTLLQMQCIPGIRQCLIRYVVLSKLNTCSTIKRFRILPFKTFLRALIVFYCENVLIEITIIQ